MSKDKNETPSPAVENPVTFTGLKLEHVKSTAAGVPAIFSGIKHILKEAGFSRGFKALNNLNQKNGFDCPSCAWPDPDDERSVLGEYCENGAKAVADEATLKKLEADFFATHSIHELAAMSDYEMGKKGRIAVPVYLPSDATHYQPISWEQAFSKISEQLNALASPDEAVFYTSGRTSNEAAFLYQLFVREFGTNNLPDCSNMCHESSGVALGESLGIGKGSVKLEDFYEAEVIIILGQNPGTNHPRMLTALQKAKANGATIISVNPLPEAGLMGFLNPQQALGLLGISANLTDLFLQVNINGDMPLLQAIEKLLLEAELEEPGKVFDQAFIQQQTIGFESFNNHLQSLDFDTLVSQSGVNEDDIRKAATILKNKKKIIACWAMGLTQHKNAVDTIREIVNLLLLKGSIGKPGAGTCPVRGHSNVQGDRTMGIYEKPPAAFLQSIEKHFNFTAPTRNGYDVVESIHAMYGGKVKVFIAMGGNFLSATPDTSYTAKALQQCALTVQVSTKLNRSHLIHGKAALILPCLGRSDEDIQSGEKQFVSCENSMGVVQASTGILKPVSAQLLSEPIIVCRMAKAVLGNRSTVNWDLYTTHYDHIRNDIEQTIPGFEHYNKRIRIPGGFYLPNCNRDAAFNTASFKAAFNTAYHQPILLKPGELCMMTIRSHDQFNTTIYGLDDRYRGIYQERRVVLLNKIDMQELGVKQRAIVNLINEFEGITRVAAHFIAIEYPIAKGCAATYFPETNVLVPINSVADKSNTPTSKSVIIRVLPV